MGVNAALSVPGRNVPNGARETTATSTKASQRMTRLTVVPSVDSEDETRETMPVENGRDDAPAETVLDLLQVSSDIDILGVVRVGVDEVCAMRAWVQALPDPRVLAWRDQHTGARYVEIRAEHRAPPVQGAITAWWRCQGRHPFWTCLLAGDDLSPGGQRDITPGQVLTAIAQLRTCDLL